MRKKPPTEEGKEDTNMNANLGGVRVRLLGTEGRERVLFAYTHARGEQDARGGREHRYGTQGSTQRATSKGGTARAQNQPVDAGGKPASLCECSEKWEIQSDGIP